MRRKLLLFVLLLAGLTNAWAEGTFVVNNPCNFVQGFNKASVDLVITDNSDNQQYIAWQARITLPTGLSYNTYEVGDINAAAHTTGTLVTESAGVITITVTSSPGTPFTASEGRLMRIYLNVADDASGDKTLSLHDVELTKYGNVAQPVSAFNYNVTIGNTITLDETETEAPAAISGVDVTVKRTLKADVWNTLVLPFDMSSGQIAETFDSGTQVAAYNGDDAEFDETNTNVIGVKMKFVSASTITAHTPYIIKVLSDMDEFTVSNVNITTAGGELKTAKGTNTSIQGYGTFYVASDMIGTYTTNTTVPAGKLYLIDNEFKFSQGNTKLKAFRAYFDVAHSGNIYSTAASSAPAITLDVDGISTGINALELDADKTADSYYTVQGLQVAQPTKGLYIVNGRKVIIK